MSLPHCRPASASGRFAETVLRASTARGTGIVVAFAIRLVIAWCFRRLWLEQLAWCACCWAPAGDRGDVTLVRNRISR